MSKQAAMELLTGSPAAPVSPSLITPDVGTEVPRETSTPESPKDELQSSRLAALAKKEMRLVKEQEQIKHERLEWETKVKRADEIMGRANQFEEMKSKDAIQALKMIGFTENDIFNFMAQGTESKEKSPQQIAEEVADQKLKAYEESLAKKQQDEQTKYNDRLIAKYKTDIGGELVKRSSELKHCAYEGPEAELQAYMIAEEVLKTTGEMLRPDEALDMAESYYKDKHEGLNKLFTPEVGLSGEKTPESPKPQEQSQVKKPVTLTNKMTPAISSAAPRHESREEKRTRLENALRLGVVP